MINFWSYKEEYKRDKKKILNNLNKTLSKGNLFFGEQQKKLETNFSKKYKSKYAVSVGSGTDALLISLLALGIGKGDEIITAANTAIPTISAIISSGATPILVDIDENYLINTKLISKSITKKTKAIIPVHLYGQICDIDKIISISKKYKLKIIEDCAQAQGAKYKNKYAGTFGNLGCFSFYPTKILGAYGDGGMILTNNFNLYKKIRRIRFYGIETLDKKNIFLNKYYANEQGVNSRLDEIQSTILNFKIKSVELKIKRRRSIARKYLKSLSSTGLKLPHEMSDRHHVYHLFTVFHPKGKKIISLLKKRGIQTRSIYPFPIHKMKAYSKMINNKKNLENSVNKSRGIFCLPLYPELKNKEIRFVIKNLRDILSKLKT